MMCTLDAITVKYAQTEEGKWLNDIDWRSVPVEFTDLPFGIVGTYSWGKIKLLPSPDVGLIFPVYIHELRHRWQSQKHPLKYIIGKLYRPIIEKDADDQELLAETWYYKE